MAIFSHFLHKYSRNKVPAIICRRQCNPRPDHARRLLCLPPQNAVQCILPLYGVSYSFFIQFLFSLFLTVLEKIVMYLLDDSAQCEQRKDIRDNHQGIEGILHGPYKLYLCQRPKEYTYCNDY